MVKRSIFFDIIFNTKLWAFAYLSAMVVLSVLVILYGWDAGIDFVNVRMTLHYRTGIMFIGIGLAAILKFRKMTSNVLACYISIVLAYGAYGISEIYLAIPQFIILQQPLPEFLKNMFYWLFYLFQLIVIYTITTQEPKVVRGVWDSSKLKFIIILGIISIVTMEFGIYVLRLLYTSEIAYIANVTSKLLLTIAFLVYIFAWRVNDE